MLTYFGHPELEADAAYYSQLQQLRDWTAMEQEAWDNLERLQRDPARLDAVDVTTLRGAIARTRTANRYVSAIARSEWQRAVQLGVPSVAVDAQRVRAACAALPIDVAAVAKD